MDKIQRWSDMFKERCFKARRSQKEYITSRRGWMGMQIKERGLLICVLMLNAPCYFMHSCTTRLRAQMAIRWKARSAMYQWCLTLMLTQTSTGAGLRLKAWVASPTGMWARLPRVPSHSATALADIKGLLLFLYLILSPFLQSRVAMKKSVARHAHKIQQMLSH